MALLNVPLTEPLPPVTALPGPLSLPVLLPSVSCSAGLRRWCTRVWNLFLLVSTLDQEAVLSPSASTTQPWCHLESWQWRPQWRLITCITKCLQKQKWGVLFAAFPTLPLETFLLVISSPGADPLSPGSNTRYLGDSLPNVSHPFPPHPLFWQWPLFVFQRERGGNLPCFEGIKCDNTALTSQGAVENS